MKEIYFDNSATTRICEEALEEYIRISREVYGNPSSRHRLGFLAEQALNRARADILASLGAREGRILFTSGGTEGNNLALSGRAHAKTRFRGGRIITTMGEHSSVSETLNALSAEGFDIVRIPTVGGVLDMRALADALSARTVLVSVMAVNSETGALYPLKQIADAVHRMAPEALFHVDATQSYMKVPFTPKGIGADLITLSSHKIEGPKGVGALWVADGVIKQKGLSPLLIGGGQEGGLRSGTENVPGACAFGVAARTYFAAFRERHEALSSLRAYLIEALASLGDSITLNIPAAFAPHILSVTVRGMKSETVLNDLSDKGIYVSSGSACSSHDAALSSALLAFGKTEDEADSTIRVSLSYRNTREEADAFVAALGETIRTRAKKQGKG